MLKLDNGHNIDWLAGDLAATGAFLISLVAIMAALNKIPL